MIKKIITSKINYVELEHKKYILDIQENDYQELLKHNLASDATSWGFTDLPEYLQWEYDYENEDDTLLKQRLSASYLVVEIDYDANNEFAGATLSIKHRGEL